MENRKRSPHSRGHGMCLRTMVVWCAAATVFAAWGQHRLAILALLVCVGLSGAMSNVLNILAANWFGVGGLDEAGIGIGPALLWFHIRNLVVRFNLLPLGAYVRFAEVDGGPPTAIAEMGLSREAIFHLSAPICLFFVGYVICAASGAAGAPFHALLWLASPTGKSLRALEVLFSGFLNRLPHLQGLASRFGEIIIATAAFGILPFPGGPGATVTRLLVTRLLGQKKARTLLVPLSALGAVVLLGLFVLGGIVFFAVAFGNPS